ncbi:PLD nuclease N-terminal domain-containing protein [soil metagenome]
MVKILAPIIILLVIFSVVDISVLERSRVRFLPKLAWIVLVVLLPIVGPVIWFIVGRGRPGEGGSVVVTTTGSSRLGPMAPDDDPDFLSRLRRENEQERRIRELEKRLNELGDDSAEK